MIPFPRGKARRGILFPAALLGAILLLSCGGGRRLVLHYYRYGGDYEGWNVWAWPAGGTGESFGFGPPDAGGFVTALIPAKGELGVIVRRSAGGNEWAEKDGDTDRFVSGGEVWLVQNDPEVYTEKPDTNEAPILFAAADSPELVTAYLARKPAGYGTFAVYSGERRLAGSSRRGEEDHLLLVELTERITDVSAALTLRDESGVFSPRAVVMRNILDAYYYGGDDLGLTWTESGSVFRVWAPTALSLQVALYDEPLDGDDAAPAALRPMTRGEAGLWSASLPGNLEGKFYLYRAEFSGGRVNWAADPYARAVSANGRRTAIVNLAAAKPPRWRPEWKPPLASVEDTVIYEVHVRDFSIDPDSGMKNRGKFLAFTERGTRNAAGHPTGLDHLTALGITHVHLLPSFDFASVDELAPEDKAPGKGLYNWGYDPQNYNVPEGSYSTDPRNPRSRIIEFKALVQALHDAGIRVVMDVVYNHTYETASFPFELLVPGYFYRTTERGALSNGSGCGNEVASERPMVRKFIVDSCLYWAREYNVDGFRFDLMALIDRATMGELTERVRRQSGETMIIYGEPWGAGPSALPDEEQTGMGAQRGMGIAVFNDRFRTALKGGSDDASRGFATGEPGLEEGILQGLRGSVDTFTDRPGESVNYVTAHDNLNLWDKMALSLGAGDLERDPYGLIRPGEPLLDNGAVRSCLLANGIILTSQGIPFFQAGDEMLRSKRGDPNSYASGDGVNRMLWENASRYREVFDYYAGLIALRRAHPAFTLKRREDLEQIRILHAENLLVGFTIEGRAGGDAWGRICVWYNGAGEAREAALPPGRWYQVVNGRRAGTETLAEISSGSITLEPRSVAVLHD
jgi:pullulanase